MVPGLASWVERWEDCDFSLILLFDGSKVIGDRGRRGDRGGGIYKVSIGGGRLRFPALESRMGDLEYERLLGCSCGVLDLYCPASKLDGSSDSRRRGTCDAGIARL